MARYGIAVSKAGVNVATTTYVNLWSPTSQVSVREISIGVSAASTNAQDWYIVRSTARGTQTTSANGTAMSPNPGPASVAVVDSAWSGNPTVGAATTAIRRLGLPVTVGGGMIFSFGRGDLMIPNGGGLAIVNANASGATTGTFVFAIDWEE